MLFSIIVPTYNRSNEVVKLLKTILVQTYQDFEIIVIDDGSTDDTEGKIDSIFKGNAQVKYIKQENSERAAARNHGVRLARGEYVNFFDSDDLMYKNHLEAAFAFIKQLEYPEIVAMGYEFILPNGELLHKKTFPANLNEQLIEGNQLSCNCTFVRKDVALQFPFNEDRNLSVFEDWELWLRLAARYHFHTSKEITSVIVNHEERSVLFVNKEKMINRGHLLYKYLNQDALFLEKYSHDLHKLRCSIFSYISLHLTLSKKHRKSSLSYFLKAIFEYKGFILKRRFWAIIKHWF